MLINNREPLNDRHTINDRDISRGRQKTSIKNSPKHKQSREHNTVSLATFGSTKLCLRGFPIGTVLAVKHYISDYHVPGGIQRKPPCPATTFCAGHCFWWTGLSSKKGVECRRSDLCCRNADGIASTTLSPVKVKQTLKKNRMGLYGFAPKVWVIFPKYGFGYWQMRRSD